MSDFVASHYEWFRAIHIIFVIYWMAGLLYLPRLFVYHSKAEIGSELDETLKLQEQRLLRIIMNPAMIVAFITGIAMVTVKFTAGGWIHAKLLLVVCLMGYHGVLSADRKKFERGERPRSEKFYRIFNEVPAILTIIIVILVVIEPF